MQQTLHIDLVAILALDLATGCKPSVLDGQILRLLGTATETSERRQKLASSVCRNAASNMDTNPSVTNAFTFEVRISMGLRI